MTISNKITITRICLIPVMIIFALIPSLNKNIMFWGITAGQLIFTIIFIIAAASDFLDGYLARKRQEITTFGKFLDPIADKLLVLAGFLFLLVFPNYHDQIYLYQIIIGVIIILLREFLVTGIRLVAVDNGLVIAASKLGKLKTITTMLALIMMLFNGFYLWHAFEWGYDYLSLSLFWIAVVLTLVSGIDYLIKNRKVILQSS